MTLALLLGSQLEAFAAAGYEVIAACPEGYEPAVDVNVVRDPREAARLMIELATTRIQAIADPL